MTLWLLPTTQLTQVVAPEAGAYFPVLHFVQLAAAAVL